MRILLRLYTSFGCLAFQFKTLDVRAYSLLNYLSGPRVAIKYECLLLSLVIS